MSGSATPSATTSRSAGSGGFLTAWRGDFLVAHWVPDPAGRLRAGRPRLLDCGRDSARRGWRRVRDGAREPPGGATFLSPIGNGGFLAAWRGDFLVAHWERRFSCRRQGGQGGMQSPLYTFRNKRQKVGSPKWSEEGTHKGCPYDFTRVDGLPSSFPELALFPERPVQLLLPQGTTQQAPAVDRPVHSR